MVQGLSSAEVAHRKKYYGLNVIQAVNPNPWWKMLLAQFTDFLVIILIISSGIAIFLGIYEQDQTEILDGIIIVGIVILNASIGFFQEFKTDRALEALKKLISPFAIAIRNGEKAQVKAEDIVPGDMVVLNAGDKIVADGRAVESFDLMADEAALTGESIPVQKYKESKLFMGTSAVSGAGLMEVLATGMKTEFGKIASLTTETVQDKSPLQKELYSIGLFVTKITLILSSILILSGVFFQGKHFLEALLFAVSVAVAAVPEGLPATITVALALGGQELVKKHVVVKQLSSIETLGSTTVICSDKTGTLTKNEMTVTKLVLGIQDAVDVTGVGYNPENGEIGNNSQFSSAAADNFQNLEKIRLISEYCTEADLQKKDGRYVILGDPTEGALLTMARKKIQGQKEDLPILEAEILEKIPFDSERKLMSVLVRTKNGSYEMLTKGSPDILVSEHCSHIILNGKVVPLTSELKEKINKMNESLAHEALRVLGFAYRPFDHGILKEKHLLSKELEHDLIFVGLAGMIDPPREEVKKSVEFCHAAGVRTIVITGDHGLTAKAIAKQIGLANYKTPVILGHELESMTNAELDQILLGKKDAKNMIEKSIIFSRVSPEHKRRIVDRLKEMGEIVAVTGDGVNDAPALKRADLGVAMGITGTEVSKETANMILMDDSFASIIHAIREGRKIYANLKKFTWFIFSTNIGELVLVFSAILLNIPSPLSAALILAVNVGTDVLPAIALGVDHGEPDLMDKPPRDPTERIMNRKFVKHFSLIGILIGGIVLFFFFFKLRTLGWEYGMAFSSQNQIAMEAMSFAFAMLVVMELFNAYNARSFTYSIFKLRTFLKLTAANLVSLSIVFAIVYVPFLQNVFHSAPLKLFDWMMIIAAGVSIIVIEEIRKFVIKE